MTKTQFYIETERLILRSWQEDDLRFVSEINADPEVMRYFPAVLTFDESKAFLKRAITKSADDGFCFSPVEVRATGEFIGFVGLSRPSYAKPLPFDPCVEIGWRLRRSAWGKGFASEAAGAWLRFGFETLNLSEIVSFTALPNEPSQKVMQRLGMERDKDGDFLMPSLDADHWLALHALYRLSRTKWCECQS